MSDLHKIYLHSAGIDIGSEKVYVAVEGQPVRNFKTFTSSYKELGIYLKLHQVTHVAMEATGIYWITLFDILEELGFDVTLVNPADSKNLPGRKTDVQDCQWIQQLFSYGLLRKSFVPPDIVRKLRVYTRMREDKLNMAASHINHMQKSLIEMNIRLPEVLSQTHGASGLAMIKAILLGERDANVLLSYCTSDLIKRKGNDILLALEGNYKEEYIFELQQAYDGYMFYLQQVEKCDIEAEKILQQYHDESGNTFTDSNPAKKIRHNKPNIENLHNLLMGIHGANPTLLPGLTDYSLMRLTAELGNNITQWPSIKCFVSWLGLAPGKNSSGKTTKRSKKRTVTRAGQILQYVEQGVKLYEEKLRQQQIKFIRKKAVELNFQLIEN